MHRWWAFTPPVWCEFGGFSRYNFNSVVSHMRMRTCLRFKVHLIGYALRSVSRSAHNVVRWSAAQRWSAICACARA